MAETKPLLRSVAVKMLSMPHGGPMSDLAGLMAHGAGDHGEPDGDEGAPVPNKPRKPVEQDPRSQQDEECFFDPELFEEHGKPKKGEEVLIKFEVTSVGSKVAAKPIEVVMESDDDEEDGEDEDGEEDEDEGEDEEHASEEGDEDEEGEEPAYMKKLHGK